jgi:putative spermidine/putrescine transport system substrate-binding protein
MLVLMHRETGRDWLKSSFKFFVVGAATVTLTLAACSTNGGSGSSSGSDQKWKTATSASAGGGMAALISAAKKEGQLNVIALPPTWANYGNIIKTFENKYGIKVNSANPDGSSQDEINAVKQENGTKAAPDVLDVGLAIAIPNTSLFAPYKVATWNDIPAAQKDSGGLWYEDYGGYMSVGYNSAKFGTITSLTQLLGPKFKNTVALNGNPTEANAALNGVMMASLAEGGSPSNIGPGVSFFHKLKTAGSFSPVQATGATVKAGQTEVVFNWDYLNTASVVGSPTWKVFVPSNALLGGYYAQAINKNAPDPAAARLWEEFLYSQASDGGQNLWLQGGARPVEQAAMTSNGSIDSAAAAKLPPVNGTPVFLSLPQSTKALNYLVANWANAIK